MSDTDDDFDNNGDIVKNSGITQLQQETERCQLKKVLILLLHKKDILFSIEKKISRCHKADQNGLNFIYEIFQF